MTAVGPDAAFRLNVAEGRLWLQHCAGCGSHIFYPRVLCPHCGAADPQWVPASGRGVVYSRAVLHRKPKPGTDLPDTHAIVLVDLEEGPRLMSRLPGVAADDIRIGMAVQGRIEQTEGGPIVVFDPAEGAV